MNKNERVAAMRLQLAAAAGGRAARSTTAEPLVSFEKSRITLARLRFMGEEPHPAQLFLTDEGDVE